MSRDNWSMDQDLKAYVRHVVNLRVKTGQMLSELDGQVVSDQSEFNKHLSELYQLYFNKFQNRDDVNRPGFAEDQVLGQTFPKDVRKLNDQQKKALYYRIAELQEKLGHTTISSQDWSEEGQGGKSVADEIEEEVG